LPIEEYSDADDNDYIHSGSGSSSNGDIQEITNEEVKLFQKISYPLLILFLISLLTVLPQRLLLNVVQQHAKHRKEGSKSKKRKANNSAGTASAQSGSKKACVEDAEGISEPIATTHLKFCHCVKGKGTGYFIIYVPY